MPVAAFELKKNLGAASATSTSPKDVDTPPSLGNSEVSAVQHSVGEVVKPELGQRREKDGEIASTVGGKKSGNVLDEDVPSGANKVVGDPCELEEESAAVAGEPAAAASDGEVLAGEPSAQERDGLLDGCADGSHVVVDAGVGEVLREDPPSEGLLLGLEDDAEPGPLEPEVEAADAAEQAADGGLIGLWCVTQGSSAGRDGRS